MPGDWLAARRTEVAADRILDAAGELFALQEAATVGMHEIASAAGCSRATLYRYFENREALYTAYVHRESYRLYREMTEQINSVVGPGERLIEGMMASLRNVRESPALDLIRLLQRRGAAVSYHDPHVRKLKDEAIDLASVPLTPETVAGADCVVIVTDHSDLDYALVERCARLVVDTRNALAAVRQRRQAQ